MAENKDPKDLGTLADYGIEVPDELLESIAGGAATLAGFSDRPDFSLEETLSTLKASGLGQDDVRAVCSNSFGTLKPEARETLNRLFFLD